MELLNNSVWVDAKLFPRVDRVTILDATKFFRARLRSSFQPGQALRLDTAFITWDGESVLGKIPQLMMGLVIPHRKGLTLLRQHLGSEIQNFTHVVLDPEQPDVVTLVGPRQLPKEVPEGLEMIEVGVALAPSNFDQLHGTTKALIAMLKYIQHLDPQDIGERLFGLNNGWSLKCMTQQGYQPVFTLERSADEFGVVSADDPLTERASLEEQGAKEIMAEPDSEPDDEGAGDNSYSLAL
jgi:hypothetical protein